MTFPPSSPDAAANDFVPKTNSALVRHYLGGELFPVASATLMALALGSVSTAVTTLIGPAVKVVTASKDTVLRFTDLMGAHLGGWAASFAGQETMTAGALLARLPNWILILAAIKAVLGVAQWYLWERSGERASMALRRDLVGRFLALDPGVRKTHEAAEHEAALSSTVTNDVRMLREYLVHFYGGMPREAFQVLFSAVTLALLSPKLFLVFLFGIAPAGAAAARIGKKLRRRAARALQDYSGLTEWLQQRLLGIETIKHYRTEALETGKMRQLTAKLLDLFLRAARIKARTSPTLETLAVVAMAIVLVIATTDVTKGAISGAALLSFFATVAMMSQSAGKLGRYLNSNREGSAAVERLVQRLNFFAAHRRDHPGEKHISWQPQTGGATFQFQGVTVRYSGAGTDALADFSYTFRGGRVYCLVGPSGAGKSTVFATALGLVAPRAGRIEARADKQTLIYMPQKVQLAPMSLLANVAYPDADGDATKVRAALEKVGLHGLESDLPQGLETPVGEGGAGVSGGQAQRILLARLWYHRAPFVFVDEGTSALDPEVERLVYSLLKELAGEGAAVVTIAHRPSAARIADEILLLDRGRLAGFGSPDEVGSLPLFQALMR